MTSTFDFQPPTEAAGQRRLPRTLLRLVAGLFAVGGGCSEPPTAPEPVATVTIQTTNAVEVVPGGAQMLTATLKDGRGRTLSDRPITWSSSDESKVTISAGLVTGVAIGSANVTASSEGKTGSITVTVKDGGVVSATGTTFSAQGGAVSVNVPAGAVSQTSSVTVGPAATTPPSGRLLAGTAFDFGPPGLTFGQPVTITLKYNPSSIPSGESEAGLQLYEVVGSAWRVVSGSTVNTSAKTVSGAVSRVGTYAVMTLPKVETVTVGGDLSSMAVVTTRQLTATVRDNEGTTLTRPVSWSSSDAAVLSIDASTGVATAKTPGTVTITATSEGKSGNATLAVVAGPPAKIVVNAGDNQSAAAGATLPVAPSVKVTDAGDNPIANVAVTFTVGSGGGSITGGAATTNASGIATVGSWRLGTSAGPNTLVASSAAISGVSVTFQAAAGAGPAANIAAFAGNGQTATAGGNIPNPPKVKVTDANGNFVAGVSVTFTAGSGSGTVTGGSVVTDAAGIATVGNWKLGTAPGAQTLIATASGLAGSPVTFTVTAVAPVPSILAGHAGNNQTARPNSPVPIVPAFIVTDPAGVPVPGVTVTFAITAGDGSLSSPSSVTNTDGIATVSWTLGPLQGPNSLQASIPGIPPVTFNATAAALPPTAIAINAGDAQSANAGQSVPIAPSVKVTDIEGIGVPGVSVAFTIRSGGGSLTGASAVTNAQGIATVGGWTLGLGGNSIFASVPGLAGDPVIFVALGTAEVQIVTFGDSNTDLGFAGTTTQPKVGSYISSTNPAIRLGANDPNDPTQLAGKIEARWKANRTATIRGVNHGIAGTSTRAQRTILSSPNALTTVGGVTRFRGEVLGDAYPWNGGESVNFAYPNGPIQRVQAFKPRSSDFGYISIGTNDLVAEGDFAPALSAATIALNLEIMVDDWIGRGLAPQRLMITTLPPRRASENVGAKVQAVNALIRDLAQRKGIRLIPLSGFVSNDDGATWKSPSMHLTNDQLHYSEAVREWLADQIVSIMFQMNP